MSQRPVRGFALLAVLVVMATLASAYLAHVLNDQYTTSFDARAKRENLQALKEARLALRTYALIEDNTPGTLPCPAPGLDGKGSSPCGTRTEIAFGRLPWYQLGMMAGLNGSGECLWYAVSGIYKNQGNVSERNADSAIHPERAGSLTLHTRRSATQTDVQSGIVAILLAPGRPVDNQAALRTSTSACQNGSPGAFFESMNGISNADGDAVFIASDSTDSFNDQLAKLERKDFMPALLRRVLQNFSSEPMRALIDSRIAPGESGTLAELRQSGPGSSPFDQTLFAEAPETSGGNCPYSSATARQAVSWLCFNQWYEHIEFSSTGLDWQLTLALDRADPAAFRCSLQSSSSVVNCP